MALQVWHPYNLAEERSKMDIIKNQIFYFTSEFVETRVDRV